MSDKNVRWPAGHAPEGAAIHETNLATTSAPPEVVWAQLVRPESWATYYANVRDVRHVSGPWPEIALGSTFSWVTFRIRVTTEVTECVPFERLAWTGGGVGSIGHHAWLLTATHDGGTRIRTEETQRGAVSKLLAPRLRRTMRTWHQRWVDGLATAAAAEGPHERRAR